MNDWKSHQLGELTEILSGKRIFASDYVLEGILFYRSKEIIQKALGQEISNPLYIKQERFDEIKNKFGSPKDGDLLISAVGERAGMPYHLKNEVNFYFKDGNLIWFRNFTELLDSEYLCYFFKSRIGQHMLEAQMIGSAQKALTISGLKGMTLKTPPLLEQKAIAKVLTAFDDKIELLQQQNQTLETIAQTIFKEWFGRYQLDDELPAGWRVGKLRETGKVICGKTPSKSNKDFYGKEIPFIKIPDMHNQMFIVKTTDNLSQLGSNSQKNKTIPANSICISCIATVGLVSLTVQDSQTNQQINSILPKKDFFREFLYFRLSKMNKYLNDLGSGGTATLNVNTSTFSNIEIVIPTEDVLKSFNKIQLPIFEKILTNMTQIQSLTKTRDTLLPKLMSGALRVAEVWAGKG